MMVVVMLMVVMVVMVVVIVVVMLMVVLMVVMLLMMLMLMVLSVAGNEIVCHCVDSLRYLVMGAQLTVRLPELPEQTVNVVISHFSPPGDI